MIKYCKLLIILLAANASVEAALTKHKIEFLSQFGDVVNIVGGRISQNGYQKQIWSNLCYIQDSALPTIVTKPEQPIKYQQLNYIISTMIKYYIVNAHQIAAKSPDSVVNIIVYLHRDSNALKHIEQIHSCLANYYPELKQTSDVSAINMTDKFKFDRVSFEYRYGYLPYLLTNHEQADIILSISPVASINNLLDSEHIIVPTTITPMNLDSMTLMLQQQYTAKNHLTTVINQIVDSQDISKISKIDQLYINKPIHIFTAEQFKLVNLIQVDGYFKPSILPDFFYVR